MYTTLEDLQHAAGGASRLVELADWDGDGIADATVLERAQLEADGFIDSHLRRFSAADLADLRADPTDTIKRLAAAEAIFQLREKRPAGVTKEDIDLRTARVGELKEMRVDRMRAKDTKTARARIVDLSDHPFSRDKFGGGGC
jgi:hypothetical protein